MVARRGIGASGEGVGGERLDAPVTLAGEDIEAGPSRAMSAPPETMASTTLS
jgi:hypothetical protein